MDAPWLSTSELAAWTRFVAVVELLPGLLDSQLRRDSDLTHFEYFTLAMLSEAPDGHLQMTELASRTNATLPRLSHVVRKLEARGLLERSAAAHDRRAIEARLTPAGRAAVEAAAPGHVRMVRSLVIDPLNPAQVHELARICDSLLERIDPDGRMLPYGQPLEDAT